MTGARTRGLVEHDVVVATATVGSSPSGSPTTRRPPVSGCRTSPSVGGSSRRGSWGAVERHAADAGSFSAGRGSHGSRGTSPESTTRLWHGSPRTRPTCTARSWRTPSSRTPAVGSSRFHVAVWSPPRTSLPSRRRSRPAPRPASRSASQCSGWRSPARAPPSPRPRPLRLRWGASLSRGRFSSLQTRLRCCTSIRPGSSAPGGRSWPR